MPIVLDRDRPSVLFEHASNWLVSHKALLPGVTVIERFVAEIRARTQSRSWRRLVRDVTIKHQARLDQLLTIADGSRQSWLGRLRKGPVRISGPALA